MVAITPAASCATCGPFFCSFDTESGAVVPQRRNVASRASAAGAAVRRHVPRPGDPAGRHLLRHMGYDARAEIASVAEHEPITRMPLSRLPPPAARAATLLLTLLAFAAFAGGGSPSIPGDRFPEQGLSVPAPNDTLPEGIRRTLKKYGVPAEAVSIRVQSLDSGEPRLRFNTDRPRNPASVFKLFTTYAALETLGAGHTWETRVHADGPINEGVLAGDLWIEGSGDPFLTAEAFWKLVGAIRRRGIRHIEGDLIFDVSRFAPVERDPGAFDDRPFRAYNQPPHPLLVNLNTIEFELEATDEQSHVRVSMHPPLGNVPVENRLRLDPAAWCGGHRWHVDYDVAGGGQRREAILDGRYGSGCGISRLRRTAVPVEDYVHGLFSALWQQWGGTFEGEWRAQVWQEAGATPLARQQSRPLAEIVRLINKHSNNVMTRQLALALAARNREEPVSEADGRNAVRAVLRDRGIDMEGLVLDEVAGLSRDNRVTADQVTELLTTARNSLVMPEFLASLPVAGVDGTMRSRLRDGPEAGRIRVKTGMIDDVAAIAGYMRNAADEELTVVVLINDQGAHRGSGRQVQDEVLRWAFRSTS